MALTMTSASWEEQAEPFFFFGTELCTGFNQDAAVMNGTGETLSTQAHGADEICTSATETSHSSSSV